MEGLYKVTTENWKAMLMQLAKESTANRRYISLLYHQGYISRDEIIKYGWQNNLVIKITIFETPINEIIIKEVITN